MRSTEAWAQGRAGEEAIIRWFKQQDYYVTPTSFIERDNAPLAEGRLGSLILPDLLVATAGASKWVECKAYRHAAPWWTTSSRKGTPRYRHGIPLRNWQQYLRLQSESGIPGSIAILEESGRLLLQTLDILRANIAQTYLGTNMPSGQQVFFWVEAFEWHWADGNKEIPWIEPQASRVLEAKPAPLYRQLPFSDGGR